MSELRACELIDNATDAALLVFGNSEAAAVRDVATVRMSPFYVELTASQRRELLADLNRYEQLLKRRSDRPVHERNPKE